jgi:predicted DsbA family dithiol-disulfide isomerase
LRYVTQVNVNCFTDPVCPWSWALEPALRRLLEEFAGSLRITYVMCGMVREWEEGENGSAAKLLPSTLEAQSRSGMPADARQWLEEPPRSSHPACIAVKAAAEQGDPAPYLRRLRVGFMCRRQRLDTADALMAAARGIADLDQKRFEIDLRSHAALEAFGADLELARAAASRAGEDAAEDRPELPSLEFQDGQGAVHGVYGFASYEELRNAAIEAGAEPTDSEPPKVEEALRRHGTLATAEVAALCQLGGPCAPAELWRLALEWRVAVERVLGGELWTLLRV